MTAKTKTKESKLPPSLHMKATISREKLLEALAAVTAAVPGKTTLPVLGNILIETSDIGLRMTATDLDLTIETVVAADVETHGKVTIPAKRLLAIAKEHLGGDLYAVVAEWDLTEIERAIMAGRARN